MILIFQERGEPIPLIDLTLTDTHYDDLLEHLKTCQSDAEIQHLEITYIDRGVHNWQEFWIALQNAFPSLKALTFEQNYPMREGPWKTAETFFQQTTLTHLTIKWFQSYDTIKETNKSKYSITVIYTKEDEEIVML